MKGTYESITLMGEDGEQSKKAKLQLIEGGDFYVLTASGQFMAPVIYDYWDYNFEYFNNLFKQRNKYYRKLMMSGQLTNLEEIALAFQGAGFYINTYETLLPIDCLDLPFPVENLKMAYSENYG